MAERGLPWEAGQDRREYLIRTLSNRGEIRALLQPQREHAAYALAQLEPGLFERTRWFTAEGRSGYGVVVHSRGGLGDATVVLGDPEAAAAILSIEPGPARSYLTCKEEHLDAVSDVYKISNSHPMLRMVVDTDTFKPQEVVSTVRLLGIDIRRINQLYGSDGHPTYYESGHIEGGVYQGVNIGGRLVAIAGTHVVSPQERIAVVGNVFTHPRQRGQGYATAATSAATKTLLEHCDTVVLTVDPRNAPAVAAYQRLGYRDAGEIVEAIARRHDSAVLKATARRFLARLRGRQRGKAIVSVRL
ncbi:MAG: hypothetical protein CL897_07020 [Dehalococcoidia bacterium]|nr:hypothetical protein [Dehalococcoidia bacterium]